MDNGEHADLVLRVMTAQRERLFAKLPKSFRIDPQVSFKMVTGTWRQIIQIPEIPFTIDWPYIEHWRAQHGTLDALPEAKDEASVVWEADERENAAE
jgi:hypothetical protein